MDLPSAATLQTIKERMREKINGTLKAVKAQASLAAKIKSKNLNNSSVLKISLKHNNRALACALTAEKENARILESDKMILQKEVKMLHFQNALLRQNLSIVNRMLKDINVFMNINLPTAIEISSISESSDLLATEEQKSERLSQESRFSADELHGFRLTGMALRVPSSATEQQKRSSIPTVLLEDECLITPQYTEFSTAKEKSDGLPDSEKHASLLTVRERHSALTKNVYCDSSVNVGVSSLLPLDEDMISGSRGGGFVTRRRKRSTGSRSSTQSSNLDFNHSKNSQGIGRESCCVTQWEINKSDTAPPEPEPLSVPGENALYYNFDTTKDMLEISHSPLFLNPDKNFNAKKDTQLDMETTHQANVLHSEEWDHHSVVNRPVEQEKTVYEADMEMTSSDSAAIVAVLPKRKMKNVKSSIPVKQDGASLRRVKAAANEKTKKGKSCKGKDSSVLSKSNEITEISLNTDKNIPLEFKPPENFKLDSSDKYDSRRTFVLPGPLNKDETKVFESKTEPYSSKDQVTEDLACSVEEIFTDDIDGNIPLEIAPPTGFKPDSTDKHDSRRTFILPFPVNKEKGNVFGMDTKLIPSKNEVMPLVVCNVKESFTDNIDKNISSEFKPSGDLKPDSTDYYNSRRTYVLPDPVKKDKTKASKVKSKPYPGKDEAEPSVVCSVKESFVESSQLCNANSDSAVESFPSSVAEHITNDTGVKKRKSKLMKRPAKDMENSKKKRKIITNVADLDHIGEAQDSHRSIELDSGKIKDTITSMKNQAPHIRRETYVLSSTKPTCVLPEVIPKDDGNACRRETFVIPGPNHMISVSEESLDHPLQSLNSSVPKNVQQATVVGTKKSALNIASHGLATDCIKPVGFGNSKGKRSSNLFSGVDKRKTRVLPTSQNDFSNGKDTLVRESCVNAMQNQYKKPNKFLNAMMANEQDSFMLDMVSESILDGTLDCPSFVEFPSANNLETASMYNVSLNNIPLLDSPVSDEHDAKENEQLNASSSDVLDKNDSDQEIFEDESNQRCKVENQSIEINDAENKPFQDLTNKTRDLTKQSPKSCSEDQEEEHVHSRRRRNPVNYKEPSLGKKLRRGDTNTEFLKSPVSKGKGKKGGRRKKKIKSEECQSNIV